jgi:hypothetical protein
MTILRRALVASLAAAASFAVLPGIAGAAGYAKPKLESASLQVADVPAGFWVNGDRTRSLSYTAAPKTLRFEACVDKDGNKVFGRVPVQHENSMVTLYQVGSGADTRATRAVSSDIYAYRSRSEALRAWKALERDRRRCAPKAGTKVPFQGIDVEVDARQELRTLPRASGMPGYTLEQNVEALIAPTNPQGLSLWVGGFTAYRQVGRAIVRAQFANYNRDSREGAALTDAYRSFTTQEALRVARRLR